MARLTLVSSIILMLCCVAAASTFEDSNPIRMVSDGLRGYESSTVEEMKLRFQIFKENLDLIRSTNKKGLSYTLAVNRFADWSWDEFQKHRLGAAQNCSATTKGNHQLTDVVLPESIGGKQALSALLKNKAPVDLAGHSGLYARKNFRDVTFYDICSTTGALEAAYHQAFGKGISLSEQQLVDCAGAFNNFGCHGGLPSQAFEYIKYNGGLDTEEAYPYTAKDGECKFSPENVGVQVIDSVNITLGAEDELKHAVALVRPVSVAFQVITSFRFYKTGVFTSDKCGTTSQDVNHAVLAVGYGVENGVSYWLIKNSWGAQWGDNGYFKMEMGKNMCGKS
ncbi:hypothetical protein Gotur_023132 [Gossypium turneri]